MGFYRKNIGAPQQILRLIAGLGAAGACAVWLSGPLALAGIASGLMLAVTGLVGYCPLCAVAGRGR